MGIHTALGLTVKPVGQDSVEPSFLPNFLRRLDRVSPYRDKPELALRVDITAARKPNRASEIREMLPALNKYERGSVAAGRLQHSPIKPGGGIRNLNGTDLVTVKVHRGGARDDAVSITLGRHILEHGPK